MKSKLTTKKKKKRKKKLIKQAESTARTSWTVTVLSSDLGGKWQKQEVWWDYEGDARTRNLADDNSLDKHSPKNVTRRDRNSPKNILKK